MDNLSGNVSFLQSLIPAIITAIITIIGFTVTYILTRRTFIEETRKQKLSIFLEKMESIPIDILELMDDILDMQNQSSFPKKFKSILLHIFAYGSKESVKIAVFLQELNFKLNLRSDPYEQKKVVVYLLLLICQIKYDLTNVEVNPQYWLRMKMKDYTQAKTSWDKAINDAVDEIALPSFMKISL